MGFNYNKIRLGDNFFMPEEVCVNESVYKYRLKVGMFIGCRIVDYNPAKIVYKYSVDKNLHEISIEDLKKEHEEGKFLLRRMDVRRHVKRLKEVVLQRADEYRSECEKFHGGEEGFETFMECFITYDYDHSVLKVGEVNFFRRSKIDIRKNGSVYWKLNRFVEEDDSDKTARWDLSFKILPGTRYENMAILSKRQNVSKLVGRVFRYLPWNNIP